MRRYADPRQVLYATTLDRVVPRPPPPPDDAALLLNAADFDAWLRGLHPGVALLFSQAVGELVMAFGPETVPSEARRRVRGGLYAGYSHGRACLGAVGAPASVFLALPEEVAACLEGVAVRLDPALLRALLRSEAKGSGRLTDSPGPPAHSGATTVTQAFDYGLAVAVVECDLLDLP
jgi:hypothetical protein